MKRWPRLLALVFTLFLLGCTSEYGQVTPTIGPVQRASGGPGQSHMELLANTNCAEVGEVVTFTARLANQSTDSITVTGTPLIDIVLQPARWSLPGPAPVQRWSQSNQYPASVNAVLAPGEVRSYQWQWAVDAVYGQDNVRGIEATFTTGEIRMRGYSRPAGGVPVTIGVVSIPWGNHGEFPCARMPR